MSNGFKLVYQKDLSKDELEIAKVFFAWFIKESFSGKSYFDHDEGKWIINDNLPLPSWKHLTRGGHESGRPLQRGIYGMCCSGNYKTQKNELAKTLLFRRVSRRSRIFGVQRKDSVEEVAGLGTLDPENECPCKGCLGGRRVTNLLTKNDYLEYAVIGDYKTESAKQMLKRLGFKEPSEDDQRANLNYNLAKLAMEGINKVGEANE